MFWVVVRRKTALAFWLAQPLRGTAEVESASRLLSRLPHFDCDASQRVKAIWQFVELQSLVARRDAAQKTIRNLDIFQPLSDVRHPLFISVDDAFEIVHDSYAESIRFHNVNRPHTNRAKTNNTAISLGTFNL
jgi:hypothetical protein